MTVLHYILLASGLHSTTYGHGSRNCGDVHAPRKCEKGAITASGDIFDPDLPTAAVAAPAYLKMTNTYVYLKIGENGTCKKIKISDKMNQRFVGVRGFDLTPAAIELLTGNPATRHWSGIVHVCYISRSNYEVQKPRPRPYREYLPDLKQHPLIQ